ncbi:MAG: hypothetical protein K2X99_11785 [Gemmatimonadaceae bacterium]|nr:hypothetical protein [Gemmatimonadaceae bacterium]
MRRASLLVVLLASTSAAQGPDALAREAAHASARAQIAQHRFDAARTLERDWRASRDGGAGIATATIGAFTVRHSPTLSSLATTVVGARARAISSRLSAPAAARLARDTVRVLGARNPSGALVAFSTERYPREGVQPPRERAARARLEGVLTDKALSAARDGLTPELHDWLAGADYPIESVGARTARAVYETFALSPSRVAHECLRTGGPSCRTLLRVEPTTTPLRDWYTSGDYRGAIARTGDPAAGDSAAWATRLRCTKDGDAATCDALARALPAAGVPWPIAVDALRLLLDEALLAGGPGAADRLLAPAPTIGDQLAHASGLPIDTLVARWRTRVLAARGVPMDPNASVTFTTPLWMLLALSIGAMRRQGRP